MLVKCGKAECALRKIEPAETVEAAGAVES
jgi:hypothetical protein